MAGKFKFNFLGDRKATPAPTLSIGVEEEEIPPFNTKLYKNVKFGGETADSSLPSLSKLMLPEEEQEQPEEMTSVSPEFEATKAYINHMRAMPKRDDYKPTFMNKLLATLAGGLSGKGAQAMAIARDTVNRPFNTALADWENQGAGLGEAAKAEAGLAGLDLKQRDAMMKALGLQSLDNYRNRTADTRDATLDFNMSKFEKEQKARADALVANGWKVSNIGGRVVAHNPLTQEKRDLGEDKSATIAEGNLNVNRQNASTNRMRAGNEARNIDSLIDSREENAFNNRLNIGIKLMTAGKNAEGKVKQIPVREQALAEVLSAQEVVAANPQYKKFLDADGNIILDEGTWKDSADNSDFAAFKKLVTEKANQRLMRRYNFTSSADDEDEEELDFDELPPG